jgi:hypothetical protein
VDSAELGSKALRITGGAEEPTNVRVVVGDGGFPPYTETVYYIDFRAYAPSIPEYDIGATSIAVWSAYGKIALRLKLYNNAYYFAEGVMAPDSRLAGDYDPRAVHCIHIELDLAARKYSICIDNEIVLSNRPLLDGDFTDVHSLEIFAPQATTQSFTGVYVIDDLLITKHPQ